MGWTKNNEQYLGHADKDIVGHLALVWNTAAAALEAVGQKTTGANMHVMVEEAGKLLRPLAPVVTPNTTQKSDGM
jgi:hypothetical protein